MTAQQAAAYCHNCGRPDSGLSRYCRYCGQLYAATAGVRYASFGQRLVAWLLDQTLWIPTLIIGYIIWWLIVLANGQTPGKQIVGIWVARADGARAGWCLMFVRELLVKATLFGFLSAITASVLFWLNYLWPLWDRDMQALHDKVVDTVVVTGP